VILAWLIVMLVPLELVRVPERVLGLLTGTLPKLRLAGFETRLPAAIATPETGTLTTEFGASLVTATLPVEVPADCGVNVMEKVFFCPEDNFKGKLSPLILKPRPVTDAWLMVTLVLPELISVADWVWVLPTLTLPRANTAGETASSPLPIPMPETGTLSDVGTTVTATSVIVPPLIVPAPLRLMPLPAKVVAVVPDSESVAVSEPPAAGVKFTPMLTFCPALSVNGTFKPVRTNSGSEMEA